MFKKYRKKPVVIDAVQVTDRNVVASLWREGIPIGEQTYDGGFYVKSLEGRMDSEYGAWLIRGIAGEYYTCADDIFRGSYDEEPTE